MLWFLKIDRKYNLIINSNMIYWLNITYYKIFHIDYNNHNFINKITETCSFPGEKSGKC